MLTTNRTRGSAQRRIDWWRFGFLALLAAIALVGAAVLWLRYDQHPVEIHLPVEEPVRGTIYVGDAVASPGYFPFNQDETVSSLLAAAGGPLKEADLSTLKLEITTVRSSETSQKVNVNRADTWLLEALPGIGPTLASRIVDYRSRSGPFRSPAEITRVSGIGQDVFQKLKDLITVSD